MNFKLPLIPFAILLTTIPSPGQTRDSLTMHFDAEVAKMPGSVVDEFLEMIYGKLNPDIESILADSGTFNNTATKTGQWSEYSYKPCIHCDHRKINYDSILKHNTESGNIFFLRETGEYKNGQRQGFWYTFSTEKLDEPFNWALIAKVEYANNVKERWENRYLYSTDSIQYEYRRVYYENGLANGPVYGFSEHGDTTIIGQNKNGVEHGLFKFKADILPAFDRIYENGVQVESIFYHKNGAVAARGLLVDFQPHGIFKTYNESGKLIMERTYNYGILEGESRSYYEDGTLMMLQNFFENELNGTFQYYHPNGQLWTELEMKSDKPWTAKSNFDKNGTAKDKGNLKNGTGTFKRYDPDGKLIAIEHYKKGGLIKEETK